MPHFEPADSQFEARVRASYAKQRIMATVGARLVHVAPGVIEIELPYRDDLTQQNGFVHAGIVSTIADSACGYAAFTLMPANAAVLTIEYKVNLIAPAKGERLIARGRVLKPGKTITVCAAEVYTIMGREEKLAATMMATMMALRDRPDLMD